MKVQLSKCMKTQEGRIRKITKPGIRYRIISATIAARVWEGFVLYRTCIRISCNVSFGLVNKLCFSGSQRGSKLLYDQCAKTHKSFYQSPLCRQLSIVWNTLDTRQFHNISAVNPTPFFKSVAKTIGLNWWITVSRSNFMKSSSRWRPTSGRWIKIKQNETQNFDFTRISTPVWIEIKHEEILYATTIGFYFRLQTWHKYISLTNNHKLEFTNEEFECCQCTHVHKFC